MTVGRNDLEAFNAFSFLMIVVRMLGYKEIYEPSLSQNKFKLGTKIIELVIGTKTIEDKNGFESVLLKVTFREIK